MFQIRADRSAEDRRLRKAEAAGSNPAQSTSFPLEKHLIQTFFNLGELMYSIHIISHWSRNAKEESNQPNGRRAQDP